MMWNIIWKSIEMVNFLEWRDHLIDFELKQLSITLSGYCLPGQNAYKETLDCFKCSRIVSLNVLYKKYFCFFKTAIVGSL